MTAEEERAGRIQRTREWAERFEAEAARIRAEPAPPRVDPLVHAACADAAESQARDLRAQLVLLEAGG